MLDAPPAVGDRQLAPFGRRAAPIIARARFGPYVVLRCHDPAGPQPQPGQFYMLQAATRWGGGEDERPFLPRAFSVLRAQRGELQFLVGDVGPGTRRLSELGPGDDLLIVGPLGRGFRFPRDGRRPLLVGGGVGIAPLAIWQDELHGEALALLGFRDASYAPAASLLSPCRLITEDGCAGRRGLVTDLLREELQQDSRVEVYACGPPAMLEAVRALCAARRLPAQLALESGMACGYGACFGCVVSTRSGYVRLCLDGPVLDGCELEEVAV